MEAVSSANGNPGAWIDRNLVKRGNQITALRDERSVVLADHVTDVANIRADDRQPGGHRLQDGEWHLLSCRGQHKNIQLIVDAAYIALVSEEADPVCDPEHARHFQMGGAS